MYTAEKDVITSKCKNPWFTETEDDRTSSLETEAVHSLIKFLNLLTAYTVTFTQYMDIYVFVALQTLNFIPEISFGPEAQTSFTAVMPDALL